MTYEDVKFVTELVNDIIRPLGERIAKLEDAATRVLAGNEPAPQPADLPHPTQTTLGIKFNGSHDFGSRRTTATRAFDILMTIPRDRFVPTGDPMVARAADAGISLPAGAQQAVTTAIVNLVKLGLITRKRGNKFFVRRTDVDDAEAIKIIDNNPSVFHHG